MADNLHKILAEYESKGYVIAPAGYGKTHLIALAVKEAKHRQLILTHTFAGVNSIKTKLNDLDVSSALYQVDTIASWTLRLCLAYPKTTGWIHKYPSSTQWNEMYKACRKLLNKKFIRQVVCATYTGVYVDEYQDCSEVQHSLVYALAEYLPCRILGDPLQAIFDFADKSVDWDEDVIPNFTCLGELKTPWRWYNAEARELGDWLNKVRADLNAGKKINLNGDLPKGVKRISVDMTDYRNSKRLKIFYDFLKHDDTVVAIYPGDAQSKNKSHNLAKSLAGKFSSIEEVECNELFKFLNKLKNFEEVKKNFILILKFAKKCFTGVDKVLTAGTKKGEVAAQGKRTRYPEILNSANSYLKDPTSMNLMAFFSQIKEAPETSVYRRDLLNRFIKVLKIHIEQGAHTLLESAQIYQRKFRHSGRPVCHTKLIGTTLLVKGLEYDHAIVLDADCLNAKELYVAITRGCKSLSIVTVKSSGLINI